MLLLLQRMSHQLSSNFMRTIPYGALLLNLLLIFSCGPSAEEKARQASIQKAREDSIRIATEAETKHRMERKLILEDSLQNEQSMLEGMNNRLIYLQADLVAAKDKLEIIKQPQFLRTPTEREQQIKAQVIRISELEEEITLLQQELRIKKAMIIKIEGSIMETMK